MSGPQAAGGEITMPIRRPAAPIPAPGHTDDGRPDGPPVPSPPAAGRDGTPPLPRRRGQTHIEPQLREPGGAGTGTPFGAFDAPVEPPVPAVPPAVGERAAAFRAATRRGPRRGGPGRRRDG